MIGSYAMAAAMARSVEFHGIDDAILSFVVLHHGLLQMMLPSDILVLVGERFTMEIVRQGARSFQGRRTNRRRVAAIAFPTDSATSPHHTGDIITP